MCDIKQGYLMYCGEKKWKFVLTKKEDNPQGLCFMIAPYLIHPLRMEATQNNSANACTTGPQGGIY